MESDNSPKTCNNNIVIKEYNAHSNLTCCTYIEKHDLLACGDTNGRVLIFDQKVPKPFIQLLNTGLKNDITNIQYNDKNNSLLFSCEDTIFSCSNITNKPDKKIISKNSLKTEIINQNEDGEITDFLLLPDETIIYPEQEEETFYFYTKEAAKPNNINNIIINEPSYKESDKFFVSSAYGQEFIPSSKKVCLYSFDGEIMIYDYKNKCTEHSIQIKDVLDINNESSNIISNPPFLNKIVCNKENNELICGMLNGMLVGLKASNLKKNKSKVVHNGNINELKMSRFKKDKKKMLISFGIDKCIKFINTQNFNVECYAEVNSNLIDFDSDLAGNVYFIDDNSKNLYQMQLKII